MPFTQFSPMHPDRGGIRIAPPETRQTACPLHAIQDYLSALGLRDVANSSGVAGAAPGAQAWLKTAFAAACMPGHDTTGVARALNLRTDAYDIDLDREIVLAMLASPVAFTFPSIAELESAVRIRRYIVQAARKTALAFDTEHAERPADYWTYDEARGFTVRPGRSLIEGLRKATQPEASGQLYAFSCYRATEYVTVLGIAQELQHANPELGRRLQRQWETRAVMSGRFHEAFLHEYGSLAAPLPHHFYVPGDRLWFRNPDAASSDVEGYEGSWVFYLGSGQFNNFWERGAPFTLTTKCVEIFHWRHGLRVNAAGQSFIDEQIVKARVRQTLASPKATADVLARMSRIRDPQGIYDQGGCIDATRERVRWVCPGHTDIVLPDVPEQPRWSIAA